MVKKLRVLFLDTRPIRRGAQVFVQELKQRFSSDGHQVMRIFLYEEKIYEQIPLDEFDLVMPFRDNHFFEKIPTVHPLLVYKMGLAIKDFSPDVILCNGSRTLKYAAVVKRFFPGISTKWIYRVIDSAVYWNRRSITQLYYKHLIIPALDGAVGVSQSSLDEMIVHYGFKKPSVFIPRAIDLNHFLNFITDNNAKENVGINKSAFVLLFLGNFTHQKRPDRFIKIIHRMQSSIPNLHGLMVGDGPLKLEIMDMAKDLKIHDRITYAGYQSDVRIWISMSNVLLITSETEGFPGVILEASAMGVPTISGNVGGVSKFIQHGNNGALLDWDNFEITLEYLISILSNKTLIQEWGTAAKSNVISFNSLDKVVNQYLSFFHDRVNG